MEGIVSKSISRSDWFRWIWWKFWWRWIAL